MKKILKSNIIIFVLFCFYTIASMDQYCKLLNHESIDYELIRFDHKLIQFYLQNKIVPISATRVFGFYNGEPWVCNLVKKTHRSLGQKINIHNRFAIFGNEIWFVESKLKWSWRTKNIKYLSNNEGYIHPSNGGRFEVCEKTHCYKIWDTALHLWCARVDKDISKSMIYYILINRGLLDEDLRKKLIASSSEESSESN